MTLLSQVGQVARGLILIVIAWYPGRVLISLDPSHAVDQEGVLELLHGPPFGVPILATIAVGLIVFASTDEPKRRSVVSTPLPKTSPRRVD